MGLIERRAAEGTQKPREEAIVGQRRAGTCWGCQGLIRVGVARGAVTGLKAGTTPTLGLFASPRPTPCPSLPSFPSPAPPSIYPSLVFANNFLGLPGILCQTEQYGNPERSERPRPPPPPPSEGLPSDHSCSPGAMEGASHLVGCVCVYVGVSGRLPGRGGGGGGGP